MYTASKRVWSRTFNLEEVTKAISVSEPQCTMEWYTFAQGHDLHDVLTGKDISGEVCKYALTA